MTRKSYEPAMRKKIYKQIIQMHQQGMSTPEIREELIKQGTQAPNGEPMDLNNSMVVQHTVSRFRHGKLPGFNRRRKRKEMAIKPVTKVSSRLPDTILGILTDPAMNSAQKIRMITIYAEL